jgi:hypothetical protein
MSETPFYFSIVVLIVLLIQREIHHSRIERGLIDKILIQRDLEPLPESHPLAEVIGMATKKASEPEKKTARVRFRIPGMEAFETMNKRLPVKK